MMKIKFRNELLNKHLKLKVKDSINGSPLKDKMRSII
jgi:hypothetical protein